MLLCGGTAIIIQQHDCYTYGSMKDFTAIAAFVISLVANIPYIIETIKGEVKPERISWLLWTILGFVYFFSTIYDTGAMLFTLGEVLAPIIIFILAIKYGVGGKSKFDLVSLTVALVALGLLLTTNNVFLSLCLALFIDAIGIMLTIRKLHMDRASESKAFWGLCAVASVFAIVSLHEYTATALMFPVYVLVVSLYIFVIAKPAAKKHTKEIEAL